MRAISTAYELGSNEKEYARIAAQLAERGMDVYSGYGVGAIVVMNYYDQEDGNELHEKHNTYIYGGFNINISGMQNKVHAEQLALFQAMVDMEMSGMFKRAELEKVIVVTHEHDNSLVCGHCMQVFRGISEHYGWDTREIDYISAAYTEEEEKPKNFHNSGWEFERHKLNELMGDTYVSNRE